MTSEQAMTGAPARNPTTAGGVATGAGTSAVGLTPMGHGPGGHEGGEIGTNLFEDDKQIFGPDDRDLPSGGVLD
jgi:hypothetical protein